MSDVLTTFDDYVVWYSWANSNLVRDAVVCHTAAAAATHALAAGGGRDTAAVAARTAAVDEAAVGRMRASYSHRHRYVEWFIWALANLGLPSERCHQAAEAAVRSIAAGGNHQSATEAATRLLLPPPIAGRPQERPAVTPDPGLPLARRQVDHSHLSPPPLLGAPMRPPATTSVLAHEFTGDALMSIVLGVAAVMVPLFTPIYFPALPVFGLWRGVLAVRAGQVAGGVVGLVVCTLGCLVTLLASGLLNSMRL